MNRRGAAGIILAVAACILLAACQSTRQFPPNVLSSKPAVELRAMQTRAFDTSDDTKVLRMIIATLQDLGYAIDKVEPPAGTVTATKLSVLSLTAVVHPRGTGQTVVRANAMVRVAAGSNTQVDDPAFYQQRFFEPLSKALFLSALQVEDENPGLDEKPIIPETGVPPNAQPSTSDAPSARPRMGQLPPGWHGP
jgi:hypothetical protein